MIKKVAIYCSSSDALEPIYFSETIDLCEKLALQKYNLVWGGCAVGLMKTVADTFKKNNAKVFGFLPESLKDKNISYEDADELTYTKNLQERKMMMESQSDALIVLPGGFGTLEEALEVLTAKQLKFHTKPIIIYNTNNFYDPLLELFNKMYTEKVAKIEYKNLYFVTSQAEEVMTYLQNYKPYVLPNKWFEK